MNRYFDYEKYLKLLEKEYINNHEFIASMSKEQRELFIRTMKVSCQKFHISPLTYMKILEHDRYGCAICGKLKKDMAGKLCLDHNQDFEFDDNYTKVEWIRGFLCTPCNFLIGETRDNIEIIKKAIKYLEFPTFYSYKYNHYKTGGHISRKDYNKIFIEQNGKCKICGTDQSMLKRKLAVDHDHQTGKVRGLLCQNCNSLLGHCQDNIDILKKAILYLKRKLGKELYYNMNLLIIRRSPMPIEFMKYENCFGEEYKKLYSEYIRKT